MSFSFSSLSSVYMIAVSYLVPKQRMCWLYVMYSKYSLPPRKNKQTNKQTNNSIIIFITIIRVVSARMYCLRRLWIVSFSLDLTFVLLQVPNYCQAEPYEMDDFFYDDITNKPSLSPQPSPVPSAYPSSFPSGVPSSKPSYSLQQFTLFVDMTFDEFRGNDLGEKSMRVFESTLTTLVSNALKALEDAFSVETYFKSYDLLYEDGAVRRRLSISPPQVRRMQQLDVGLRILADVYVSVRSSETYSSKILIANIKPSFDELKEREDFIVTLQRMDSTFSPINEITSFKLNDDEVYFYSASRQQLGLSTIGLSAAIISVGALFCCASYLFVHKLHLTERYWRHRHPGLSSQKRNFW